MYGFTGEDRSTTPRRQSTLRHRLHVAVSSRPTVLFSSVGFLSSTTVVRSQEALGAHLPQLHGRLGQRSKIRRAAGLVQLRRRQRRAEGSPVCGVSWHELHLQERLLQVSGCCMLCCRDVPCRLLRVVFSSFVAFAWWDLTSTCGCGSVGPQDCVVHFFVLDSSVVIVLHSATSDVGSATALYHKERQAKKAAHRVSGSTTRGFSGGALLVLLTFVRKYRRLYLTTVLL